MTTRKTDAEMRQAAVTSLGLSGYFSPKPTGQRATDEWLVAQYEQRVQAKVGNLRAIENTILAREAEASRADVQRRAEADAAEKDAARASFMASNATATESDFERLWPSIRDADLIANRNAAVDKARQSGAYRI